MVLSSGTNPAVRATNWGHQRANVLIRRKAKCTFATTDEKMRPTENLAAPLKLFNEVKGEKRVSFVFLHEQQVKDVVHGCRVSRFTAEGTQGAGTPASIDGKIKMHKRHLCSPALQSASNRGGVLRTFWSADTQVEALEDASGGMRFLYEPLNVGVPLSESSCAVAA